MFLSPDTKKGRVGMSDQTPRPGTGFGQRAVVAAESSFGREQDYQFNSHGNTHGATYPQVRDHSTGPLVYNSAPSQAAGSHQRDLRGDAGPQRRREAPRAPANFPYGNATRQAGRSRQFSSMRSQPPGGQNQGLMGNFSYGNANHQVNSIHSPAHLESRPHSVQGMEANGSISHDVSIVQKEPSRLNVNAQEFIPRHFALQRSVQPQIEALELLKDTSASYFSYPPNKSLSTDCIPYDGTIGTGGAYGVFQNPHPPASSQFPDADQKYPVEEYNGPITAEGIEEHFGKKMPFAPSRYVVETQRSSRAMYNKMSNAASGAEQVLSFGAVPKPVVTGDKGADNTILEENRASKYKGEIDMEDEWYPDDMNCKVFVTGVNPGATRKEIFDTIKDGKVQSFSYNPADPPKFKTAAFSIAFATRESTDRFFNRANNEGIFIKGIKIKVVRDRTKVKALEDWETCQSRVVRIYGPPGTLSLPRLIHVLKKFIQFELVHGTENTVDGGARSVVTIHFESIIGQARPAIKCLMNMANDEGLQQRVHTRYQPDPCDPYPQIVDRDNLDRPEH